MSQTYTAAAFQQIVTTYRRLFPEVSKDLAAYWNFDRRRPWGWLTSDFRSLTWEQAAAFHEALQDPAIDRTEPQRWGEQLRERALASGMGFSFGISPWTDDLLLRTSGQEIKAVGI